MNRKKLIELCRILYIDADYGLINDIESGLEQLYQDLELLKVLDTSNVAPMTRVHETPVTTMREDRVVYEDFTEESLFRNVREQRNNLVIIKRVVGDKTEG